MRVSLRRAGAVWGFVGDFTVPPAGRGFRRGAWLPPRGVASAAGRGFRRGAGLPPQGVASPAGCGFLGRAGSESSLWLRSPRPRPESAHGEGAAGPGRGLCKHPQKSPPVPTLPDRGALWSRGAMHGSLGLALREDLGAGVCEAGVPHASPRVPSTPCSYTPAPGAPRQVPLHGGQQGPKGQEQPDSETRVRVGPRPLPPAPGEDPGPCAELVTSPPSP